MEKKKNKVGGVRCCQKAISKEEKKREEKEEQAARLTTLCRQRMRKISKAVRSAMVMGMRWSSSCEARVSSRTRWKKAGKCCGVSSSTCHGRSLAATINFSLIIQTMESTCSEEASAVK